MEKGEKKLRDLTENGAGAITPAELLRNEGDPYRAVVSGKLEATGQILTYEEKLRTECPPLPEPGEVITLFPDHAPDAHLESAYEDSQSGSYED